jgi:hypothetical protein
MGRYPSVQIEAVESSEDPIFNHFGLYEKYVLGGGVSEI